jgi:transcriptional regulator with XRE-family HTH domain
MNKRLKELRKIKGLNQGDFSKKIGIAQNSYSLIETGKINLTDRNIKVICLVYGVNEDWLRYGKGDMLKVPLEAQSDDESKLLMMFRKLTGETKEAVLKIVQDLLSAMGTTRGEPLTELREPPPPDYGKPAVVNGGDIEKARKGA